MRMVGRNAQRLSTINNIFAQTQCQGSYSLFSLFVAYGIVVERAQHTTEIRIIAVAILPAHHFLQNDSHLLLIYDIAGGSHIGFGILVEHRRIHTLDGTCQHLQHGILVFEIGNHIGGIDTGKRLVVGILQQR